MKLNFTFKNRMICTGIVSILMWAFLAWEYFNGGVTKHHLLQSDDFPGFSNWWGAITTPLVTWVLLYLIYLRTLKEDSKKENSSIIYGFVGFLLYAVLISYLFSTVTGSENILFYMALGLIALSFFVPIYKPECLLGYLLGMTFTFGPILSLLFGVIFWTVYFIAYKLPRGIMRYYGNKKYNST